MRRFLFMSVAVALLFSRPARSELVSAVSVVVSESVITAADIYDGVEERVQTVRRIYAGDPQRLELELNKLRDQEVQRQVEDKLILHDFVTSGYVTNVVDTLIDDQIRREIADRYGGDRARFIKTLYAEGMTYETYRRQSRERFIISAMKHQNSSSLNKVLISPLKIQQYYDSHQDTYKVGDQVKLRMIVIDQRSDKPPGTAKALAAEVLAKIDSGVPFEQMAKVYSSGAQRGEGGSRGWIDRSEYRPELDQVAFSLKPGQHSGVIDLPEASYILQVDDAHPAHVKALTEVRDEVERVLKAQESLRLYKKWIDRLEKKTFIWYY